LQSTINFSNVVGFKFSVLLLRNCDGTRSPLHRFRITTTESVPSERPMKRDSHRIICQIQLFQNRHSAQLRQTECQRATMPSAPSIHQIAKECSPQRATKPSTPTKRQIAKEWFLTRHWPTRPNTSAQSEQDSFIGPHKLIAHKAQNMSVPCDQLRRDGPVQGYG
jgi:hypothetical protein